MTHDLFPFCVHVILAHEGGLTDDPNDEGGITNFGISLRFYKTIFPSATADDIRNLSESQAEQLYRTYWWNKYSYAQFKAVIVAVKVFDMAVDMGPHEAHKLLQSAINSLQSAYIAEDGILGNETFQAANALEPLKLRQGLRDEAMMFYERLEASNPKDKEFERGWYNRAQW